MMFLSCVAVSLHIILTTQICVDSLEELAHGKRTLQSGVSTYEGFGTVLQGNSSFAVDGIWKDNENQTCAKTDRAVAPWWMVDLGDEYLIKELIITTRTSGELGSWLLIHQKKRACEEENDNLIHDIIKLNSENDQLFKKIDKLKLGR